MRLTGRLLFVYLLMSLLKNWYLLLCLTDSRPRSGQGACCKRDFILELHQIEGRGAKNSRGDSVPIDLFWSLFF